MCQLCQMNTLTYAAPEAAATLDEFAPQYGGSGANVRVTQLATADSNTNALLSGSKWGNPTLTYSFPTLASQYETGVTEATNSFSAAPAATQTAIRFAMNLVSQYTNLVTTEISPTTTADVRVAFSASANPTAYAYYPSNSTSGGDIWFGTSYTDYANPVKGRYGWATAIHELGHALGLKHGHETGGVAGVALASALDQMAYSVMTYRSYMNSPLTGYTNETNGYAQTFMMYDIAALQQMYGANFNTNSGNTTYTWSSTTGEMFINGAGQGAPGGNRIFMTVWDGNGVDTYDFSNYTSNLTVDLAPGSFSTTSTVQLANLGSGNRAPGNIFNALRYNGDNRSLIENANGGTGDDTITGNDAGNVLNGNGGNDTLNGGNGNDTLDGGTGTDKAVFSGLRSAFTALSYNGSVSVFGSVAQGIDTLSNIETLQFTDTSIATSNVAAFKPYDYLASYSDLISAYGANAEAAWNHYLVAGFREGRSYDAFGNYRYIASFDDLITTYGVNVDAAAWHYVVAGHGEGRGSRQADFLEYAATYGDLVTAFGADSEQLAYHYITNGRAEGRTRDGFDNLRYTASYDDLISAFGANSQMASFHYVTYGFHEGRSKLAFDPLQYIASYGDLIDAFLTDTNRATYHFVTNGFAEGRSRDSFNASQYLANYADLRAAFGTDEVAATNHFILSGYHEGRTSQVL